MKSRVLTGTAALAVVLLTSACGNSGDAPSGASGTDGATSAELSQTTLTLGIQSDPAFTPIAVAMEKGWFQEAGFAEVETQQFVAGVEAGQALVANAIDIWQPASVPAISLINTGAPISIVGEASKCHVESLLVRPDAGVTEPEDLYNVEIGVLQGSSLNAYLANLAEHYGLDYSRLQVVNMAPAESLTALISGNIPAAVTFPPSTNTAIVDGGALEVAGRLSGFGVDEGKEVDFSRTRCVLVMPDRFVQEHRDSAVAALGAIQRAKEWINDNPEEAQSIFADYTAQYFVEQELEDVKAAWVSYTFPTELDDDFKSDLEAYSIFLDETGALAGDPKSVDELLDLSLLEEANGE